MTRRNLLSTIAVAFLLAPPGTALAQTAAPAGTQAVPEATIPTELSVTGAVKTALTLSAADLKAMPRTKVQSQENSRTVAYEGVLVGEILKRAGVPTGDALRGEAVASYVVAHATDGYRAVYSIAELDNAFSPNDIIVANTMDGKPLFAYQGPWRLVAPRDLRGARSVRLLDRLEVVRVPK